MKFDVLTIFREILENLNLSIIVRAFDSVIIVILYSYFRVFSKDKLKIVVDTRQGESDLFIPKGKNT